MASGIQSSRGLTDEEIDSQQPGQGVTDEQIDFVQGKPGNIEPSESILQRAMRIESRVASRMFSQPTFDPEHPFQSAIASTTEFQNAPGLGAYQMAERGKNALAEEVAPNNPIGQAAFSIASDPTTYIGAKGALEGAGKAINWVKNPSKMFGQGMSKLEQTAPKSKVNFLEIIRNSSNNSMVKKVLNKPEVIEALEKHGGTVLTPEGTVSENLSNLTLQQSQDIVNAMKSGVRNAVKSGELMKPTEIPISKMFSEFAKAQRQAFPDFKGIQRSYGIAKNVGKAVSRVGKQAATGAAWGAGGSLAAAALKPFLWKK